MSIIGSKKIFQWESRLGFLAQQLKIGNILKKKTSQQLVEFLLVVPFMVIILGILVEYAYALNINMTLTQGLKAITSSYCSDDGSGTNKCYGIYDKISPNTGAAEIQTLMNQGFKQYLKDNNVPTNPENNISVKYLTATGETTIFYAKYTYIPAFTLPNVYFKFLPDKFDFFASIAVPTAFMNSNKAYNLSTDALTKIWASGGDLADNPASFDSAKRGALATPYADIGSTSEILFLVPNPNLTASAPIQVLPPLNNPYELRTYDLGDSSWAVDMADGKIYHWYDDTMSIPQPQPPPPAPPVPDLIVPIKRTEYTGLMLSDYIRNNYFQVVFASGTNDDFNAGVRDGMLSLGGGSNYDNINSSTYTVVHRGSLKFVYSSAVNIGIIDPGVKSRVYF